MNITFGRKIPITYCQIYDKEKQKFVGATCYKYDCNDKSDLKEIEKLGDNWRYLPETTANMKRKEIRQNQGLSCDVVVFTIEDKKGETLGLCCAEDKERSLEVNYIESKQDNKHKFVGQVLLASIGQEVLDNDSQRKLVVKNAVSSAYGFYEDVCGFIEDKGSCDLFMPREKIHRFLKQTKQRTHSPIINLKA